MPIIEQIAIVGIGPARPDYSPQVSTGKPVLAPNETHWCDLWTTADDYCGRLPPGSLVITAYTGPAGSGA